MAKYQKMVNGVVMDCTPEEDAEIDQRDLDVAFEEKEIEIRKGYKARANYFTSSIDGTPTQYPIYDTKQMHKYHAARTRGKPNQQFIATRNGDPVVVTLTQQQVVQLTDAMFDYIEAVEIEHATLNAALKAAKEANDITALPGIVWS